MVSTPLCVTFQICVPSVADAMGVTFTSPFGRLVVSMSSVCGNTYGCRFAFVRPGVAGTVVIPRNACILPNSSKVVEFISS